MRDLKEVNPLGAHLYCKLLRFSERVLVKSRGHACLRGLSRFNLAARREFLMRRYLFGVTFILACAGTSTASADVVAQIHILTQSMTVTIDGTVRYVWPVSTARRGYATPIGSFRPIRMERIWHSTVYNNAPMPYAIFFYYGFAVHGTNETAELGRPASHGCVRLPTSAARALFELIRQHGPANSRIVVTG